VFRLLPAQEGLDDAHVADIRGMDALAPSNQALVEALALAALMTSTGTSGMARKNSTMPRRLKSITTSWCFIPLPPFTGQRLLKGQ
jgi:hypothetical protein